MKRIAYLVGSTPVRAHHNRPVINVDDPDYGLPPFTVANYAAIIDLAQLLAINWRVKKWEFACSVSGTIFFSSSASTGTIQSTTSGGTVSNNHAATPFGSFSFNPNLSESDMARSLIFSESYPDYPTYLSSNLSKILAPIGSHGLDIDAGSVIFNWSDSARAGGLQTGTLSADTIFFISDFRDPTLYDPVTKLFRPDFWLRGFITPTAGTGLITGPIFAINVQSSTAPSTATTFSPFTTFRIASNLVVDPLITSSFNIPLEVQFRGLSPRSSGTSFVSGTAAFTLTAKEFWPFANRLGQPVYDTVTGAQIADPFA